MELSEIASHFEANSERILEKWKDFLRIKSISSDPAYASEMRRGAEWLCNYLSEIGFQVELLESEGAPIVYASHPGFAADSSPAITFYGHYDVQPVEPLEEWHSKPFEPEIRDGRLYARGAQDNKGQLMYVLSALELLISKQALRSSVKLCIEGEEESSSVAISKLLPKLRDKLAADILMACDTFAFEPGVPVLTVGLRGSTSATITVKGPRSDLHSGLFGGGCPNPAQALSKLLSTFHDDSGKVAIEGFYDQVQAPTESELRLLEASSVDEESYKSTWGVYPRGGEKDFPYAVRVGRRPTLEINGLYSGHTGVGAKAIIPAYAQCKISMRLVPNQNPEEIWKLFEKHVEKHAPENVEVELSGSGGGSAALMVDPNADEIKHVREVLGEVTGNEAGVDWSGGSIPILAEFVKLLQCSPVLVGFGLLEDNIHAPNESFSLDQFRLGFLYVARYLSTVER